MENERWKMGIGKMGLVKAKNRSVLYPEEYDTVNAK